MHELDEARFSKAVGMEAAEKASLWLWLREGEVWHSALSGYKSWSYHPWLGRPGEDARPQNTL